MSRPSKSDKRKDKDGYVLRKGESQKKGDGRYVYTYTDGYKKRRYVYARTLVELRELEKKIRDDMTFDLDYSAASRMTLNDLFDRYIKQKTYLQTAVNNGIHRAVKAHNAQEKIKADLEGRDPIIVPDISAHNLRNHNYYEIQTLLEKALIQLFPSKV